MFPGDLDGDARPEVIATNKGARNPDGTGDPRPVSWFEYGTDPLDEFGWVEHELKRMAWPINSQPWDLDSDGDVDFISTRGNSVPATVCFGWNRSVLQSPLHRLLPNLIA